MVGATPPTRSAAVETSQFSDAPAETARQELRRAFEGQAVAEIASDASERFPFRVSVRSLNLRQTRRALENLGAEIVERLASGILLVRMTDAAARQAQTLPDVERVEPQLAARKITGLRFRSNTESRSKRSLSHSEDRVSEPISVEIRLFPGSSSERIRHLLDTRKDPVGRETRNRRLSKIEVVSSPAFLERLATLPEVASIEPNPPAQLFNDQAAAIFGTPTIMSALGLSGEGQIVGHADSGLDLGTTTTALHAACQGQIAAAFALGRPGDWSDPAGHGTRTAGSSVGLGALSGGLYKGLAPAARLVHQSLMDASGSLGGIPTDYGDLFEQAYQAGARIHSDSWGAETRGAYTRSVELDTWAWNNGTPRDLLIVVAAGNAGPTSATIASPATAKNCLAVGASENSRPELGTNADNPEQLATFSARGPIAGERIRPDVVAPGTWILSTDTRADYTPVDDPMETGLDSWTPQPAGSWKWTDADAHSPSHCWSESPISGYANNQDSFLISPPFDGQRARTIRFWAAGPMWKPRDSASTCTSTEAAGGKPIAGVIMNCLSATRTGPSGNVSRLPSPPHSPNRPTCVSPFASVPTVPAPTTASFSTTCASRAPIAGPTCRKSFWPRPAAPSTLTTPWAGEPVRPLRWPPLAPLWCASIVKRT
jgi:subtilisin family serine protease